MAEREPMTQTIKATEARQQWGQLLNKVFRKETRVIVEKSGIPVAAIISAEDFQRLSNLEQELWMKHGKPLRMYLLRNLSEKWPRRLPQYGRGTAKR